jgi:hypothetical protein
MNSNDYEANGYGHDLDFLIVLHQLWVSYPQEVSVKRNVSRYHMSTLHCFVHCQSLNGRG